MPRAIPSKIEWKPKAIKSIKGEMLTPQRRTSLSIGFPWMLAAFSSLTWFP